MYKLDETTGKVTGNPALAALVKDTLHAIENKAKADGGSRSHAEAMTYEYMCTIMKWSQQICPEENVAALRNPQGEAKLKNYHLVLEHLRARALFSSGFTIWTR